MVNEWRGPLNPPKQPVRMPILFRKMTLLHTWAMGVIHWGAIWLLLESFFGWPINSMELLTWGASEKLGWTSIVERLGYRSHVAPLRGTVIALTWYHCMVIALTWYHCMVRLRPSSGIITSVQLPLCTVPSWYSSGIALTLSRGR